MNRCIRFCTSCGLILVLACSTATASDLYVQKKLRIGVLVSLTGLWSTLGRNTEVALEIGSAKINAQSDAAHAGYRIELLVRDTHLVPELALEALKELAQKGVTVVIGPQSSAELALLRPYANAHDILLISQGSTASSLAIAGDNVFRLCPDDTLEAQATVALMWHDGIRTLVPFWRGDAGNDGLHDSVRAAFIARGGAVADGYRYDPATTDFTAAIAAVSREVAYARASANPSTVAVYLAAFDKVVDIFEMAFTDAVLNTSTWYGSDGMANSSALLSAPVGAAFAASVGYPNPLFGLDPANQSAWQPLATEIQHVSGVAPDAFALAAYDALFLTYRALQQSQAGKNFAALKAAFVATANSYTGVTGSTTLNAAGDRVFSDFDFWAIRPVNGLLSWIIIGRYIGGTLY
ncbi:MAG: ABC transporter substrate-binding protein [Acidobacteriia bacterium]|nr:ABC transporter substrate-binding protein [Terriglobia bacterium]